MSSEKFEKKKTKKNKKPRSESNDVDSTPSASASPEVQPAHNPKPSKKKHKKHHDAAVEKMDTDEPQVKKLSKSQKKKQKKEKCVDATSEDLLTETNWGVLASEPAVPEIELEDQIKVDNDYFMSVINMIPPQFYFDEETNKEIMEMRAEKGGMKKKGGKRRHGSGDGPQVSLKRSRFDPAANLTVQQIEARCQHEQQKSRHPADHGAGAGSSMEAIRERLHHRLQELKQKRTSLGRAEYRGEKHRIKRRESKLKRRMKLKREKSQTPALTTGINGNESEEEITKPIFNKEGKLVFSKFDFTDSGEKEKRKSEFTGKNYQKLLAKVEQRNEKLKKLKESNPEKGDDLEEKIKWQSALHKAEGIKVKDNPEMLKKALKSKERKKHSKGKKWDSRLERTEKMLEDKQQKRDTNIKARKQKNLDRKVTKLKKKGRLIPGF